MRAFRGEAYGVVGRSIGWQSVTAQPYLFSRHAAGQDGVRGAAGSTFPGFRIPHNTIEESRDDLVTDCLNFILFRLGFIEQSIRQMISPC